MICKTIVGYYVARLAQGINNPALWCTVSVFFARRSMWSRDNSGEHAVV